MVLHERGVLGSSLGRRGIHFGISGLQENVLRFVAVNPGHWWQVTVFFVARGCGGHSNGIKSMLRRTHSGLTMDTVVATEADAPRRRGTKFKLTYRKICELSVAKGPIEGKQGECCHCPRPQQRPGSPTGCWTATRSSDWCWFLRGHHLDRVQAASGQDDPWPRHERYAGPPRPAPGRARCAQMAGTV